VVLNIVLGVLAFLSLFLLLWQWLVAVRFPLHRRVVDLSYCPPITLLKPLKGADETTEASLRTWFSQDYAGPVQVLFGVASADDPVCGMVRKLLEEFPSKDSQLIICGPLLGANAKVSKLVELERLAKHEILIISDADVRVPPDFLANIVTPLLSMESRLQPVPSPIKNQKSKIENPSSPSPPVGLVNCFYLLANPTTLAMQWEAVAINADFWSQVLQAQSLKPIDFALGAVMATRKQQLSEIGGFAALADCLADDFQLGNRIARKGYDIALSRVPVECWSEPMSWAAVWKHQLRWARTIRVCQPLPYFFSILSNPTLWPLLWLALKPSPISLGFLLLCLFIRVMTAWHLQRSLSNSPNTQQAPRTTFPPWMPPLKDLLQTAIWLLAFMGNHIEWRGQRMRLRRDGTLVKPTVLL
jgi:ceramide glucosyltransferase